MPDPAKAARYIDQLDKARCDELWDAVPELVRKVRKHDPDRACLTLAAEGERAITNACERATPGGNQAGTLSRDHHPELVAWLATLLAAIENERQCPAGRFQAKVCVGWLHWVLGEYGLAARRLPLNLDQEEDPAFKTLDTLSEWTKICALRSTYLRANCLAHEGQHEAALNAFDSAIASLTNVWTTRPATPQLRYWSELLLTEYCMLNSQAIRSRQKSLMDPNCLACFRAWSSYWASDKGTPLAGGAGFRESVPRRRVWAAYYNAISEVLQKDLPYPTGFAAATNTELSARNRLRAELKIVEVIYQSLLFIETRFPKADEERPEVEEFIDQVMKNWTILNGRGWREHDLGQGGRNSLSHSVLDTLYGAAMKTFHSSAVLRHLFTVHLAVAEFDLAFKCFDSYFDLAKRGKARVERTGHPESALDDDATLLETISVCITSLCRYGGHEAAEKARNLATELENMLEKHGQFDSSIDSDGISSVREDKPLITYQSGVPRNVFALAWQSIGLAHAQWARMTYESESRTAIQDKAIECLRRSLSPEFGSAADIRGVFALGLLYAKQRKLSIGIEVVKSTLLTHKPPSANQELYNGPYWRERSLIPVWHLLALMLSARQEYLLAARACEGAIEQFKDPFVLFGTKNLSARFRSAHLNESEAQDAYNHDGLVDDMDDYEKESILEIKMTQLAILELVEGPTVAVNASSELLTLFPRLFGDLEQEKENRNLAAKNNPPKSSAGTARSVRETIFGGRSTRTRQSILPAAADVDAADPSRPATSHTVSTVAPTVHVIPEQIDFRTGQRASRRKSGSLRGRRSQSTRRAGTGSLHNRDGSRRRAMSIGGPADIPPPPDLPHRPAPTIVDGDRHFTPPSPDATNNGHSSFFSPPAPPLPRSASKSGTNSQQDGLRTGSVSGGPGTLALQRKDPIQANSIKSSGSMRSSPRNAKGALGDWSGPLVDEAESFGALLPFVQFPEAHKRQRRSAMLAKVWLTIAGFYRRANLFSNAMKAVAEAQKIVQGMEMDASVTSADGDAPGSGNAGASGRIVTVAQSSWGQRKSIDELLGDVWAEGSLSLAQEDPYQARADFEAALTHMPDHPAAIVGLSNILMDIYTEKLLPPPAIPDLRSVNGLDTPFAAHYHKGAFDIGRRREHSPVAGLPTLPTDPIGIGKKRTLHDGKKHATVSGDEFPNAAASALTNVRIRTSRGRPSSPTTEAPATSPGSASSLPAGGSNGPLGSGSGGGVSDPFPPPYKPATSLPMVDRLAARDRAYMLLSGLTKLGSGWDNSEAWFALARAYELSAQPERAKELLWWCIELEDARGVREWGCVGRSGYVLS